MNHKAFVVNKKVSIRVNEGDYQGYYSTRIEEISEGKITLALPFIGTVPVPIRIGERISIFSPSKDAVYKVDGEVIKRQIEPIPLLYIAVNGEVVRVQRRNFVRVPIVLKTIYTVKSSGKLYDTYTKDISGGGMKIVLPEILNTNEILQIRIELPTPEGPINCEGEVRWIDKEERLVGDKVEENIYAGIEFVLIEEKDRDRLIRFLFDYQRKLIKKGWRND